MTDIAFDAVRSSGGRNSLRFSLAPVLRSAAHGLGAIAAVGIVGITALGGAAWMVSATIGGRPHTQLYEQSGPRRLAVAERDFVMAAKPDAKRLIAEVLAQNERATPALIDPPLVVARVEVMPLPPRRPNIPQPQAAPPVQQVAQAAPQAAPQKTPDVAPKVTPPAPAHLALAKPAASPIVEKPQRQASLPAAPDVPSKTAVYDISARTVFLPNGRKLEAHSGIGEKMDDPRFANVRMRGVTPPNVYDLKLREALFHGVRAIRLTPTNESAMFGRDGILAHTYMLGPSGQSNGCVSFKDYDKFLQAFLAGEVDRIVVVPSLGNTPYQVVSARHRRDVKYAAAQ